MKYRSKDTVSSLLAIPQTKPVSLYDVPCSAVAERAHQFKQNVSMVHPCKEAVEFYAMNQLVAVIAKKYGMHGRLPDHLIEVVSDYVTVLCQQAERLFLYTTLITTRESRHVHRSISGFADKFEAAFGPVANAFNLSIVGSGSDGAVEKFIQSPPDMPLGKYLESLSWIFYQGKFSSSYGGKPWGNIADTIAKTAKGETSLEIMTDTAYTLAHNGGPMFNKGMMYKMYDDSIYKILDVQRSGQVAEMIIEGYTDHSTAKVKNHVLSVKKEFPDEIGSYVDWYAVEKLGSKKQYPTEKKIQEQKYGVPMSGEFAGMIYTGKIEVFPNVAVKLLKRKPK